MYRNSLNLVSVALATLVLLACPVPGQAQCDLAGATVVIFNREFPGSAELAAYYAQRRNIPDTNVIGLDCPQTEEISREQFTATISAPLVAELVKRELWKARGNQVVSSRVRYAVLMRGMPLKVRSVRPPPQPGETRHPLNDHDEASVDSELCLLGMNVPTDGAITNGYFRSFTPAVDAQLPAGMLLVCRLDALDDTTVRAMIDDSLAAEKRGLWGWGYADLRGISSGPYELGNQWIDKAVNLMRKKGMPVATERTESLLPTGFPMRQAAIYFGWYSANAAGPFAEQGTVFQRGGIGVHIHSFSASSLRDPNKGWVAPLLARGAAVSAGNVYEPYLGLTLHLDIFQDRLMAGLPLADAAYMATPVLSWMGIVCGDPLYRPFEAWILITPGAEKGAEWEQFRKVVLDNGGHWNLAAAPLASLARSLQNPMPFEALGCWQMDRSDFSEAIQSFQNARKLATRDWEIFRCDWWLVRALVAVGDKDRAVAVAKAAMREQHDPARSNLMLQEINRIVPALSPTVDTSKN